MAGKKSKRRKSTPKKHMSEHEFSQMFPSAPKSKSPAKKVWRDEWLGEPLGPDIVWK